MWKVECAYTDDSWSMYVIWSSSCIAGPRLVHYGQEHICHSYWVWGLVWSWYNVLVGCMCGCIWSLVSRVWFFGKHDEIWFWKDFGKCFERVFYGYCFEKHFENNDFDLMEASTVQWEQELPMCMHEAEANLSLWKLAPPVYLHMCTR